MRLLGALALLAALSQPAIGASAKQPTVHHTYFKEAVSKLVYFKSRTTMLAIDRANGKLHRSSDSGATWGIVEAVPSGQVSRLYVHPYEPQVAYALSEDTQHWMTRDEGATWEAFSTELPPTTSGERPLAFHAERTGWIMYTGERCVEEKSGWWPFPRLVCHDEPAYVRDGFAQAVKDHKAGDRSGSGVTPLLPGRDRAVIKCLWARKTKEFKAMAEEAIFCLEIVEKTAATGKTRRDAREHVMANATAAMQTAKLHRRVFVEGSNGADISGDGDGDGVSIMAETGEHKRDLADDLAALLDGQLVRRSVELIVSEDFFSTQKTVHFGAGNDGMGGDRAGGGVVAISVLKKYLMTAISHAHSDEMDLFVSMDGHTWAESHLPLPAGGEEDAYTILESSAHAVFVDVVTASSDAAVGSLFRSNSNGTYYTQALEHTHRSISGPVDVARVHGIEGVVVANQVSNWDRIGHGIDRILHREKFELRSRISFNDGARWRFLRAPKADADGKAYGCTDDAWQTGECALHVHLMTSPRMRGHVLGGEAAAGVVLAVGSVGPKLLPWAECDTFLSRDGGLTWQMAVRGPHHVQIADSGAVLVLAAHGSEATDVLRYSLDAGRTWVQTRIDAKMRVSALFGDDEGLSDVVLAAGVVHGSGTSHDGEQAIVALDFGKVWTRQCAVDANDPRAGSDTEAFVLAAHEDNDCILGHRAEHVRRKPDAQCAMQLAQVLVPRLTDCACTAHDFECDYNYALNSGGKCELVGDEVIPHGECQRPEDRFLASSGYRLIPGDTCVRSDNASGDSALDKPVEKPCPRVQKPGGGGGGGTHDGDSSDLGTVTHHMMVVRGDPHVLAFPNTTAYLMMTTAQELFRSDDEGAQWQRIDLAAATGKKTVGLPVYLAANPHHTARAYVYTDSGALAYTTDRGTSWHVMDSLPSPANGLHIRPLLDFSAASADQLLWVGGTPCPNCHTEIWTTSDHGARWTRLTTHATKCLFAPRALADALGGPAVVCSRFRRTSGRGYEQDKQQQLDTPDPGNPLELHVFTRPFDDAKATHVLALPRPAGSELVNFFVQGRFVVAAAMQGASLTLLVSDDGRTLHEARFPPGTHIAAEGFTVLPGDDNGDDSGALLVDVEGAASTGGNSGWGSGWGTLFASNSNGTHFHRVLQHTNRNRLGMVDVERVAGVRGALIANRVANAEALGRGTHVHKELRTVASWDGGRTWHALTPPTHDSVGARIDCPGCALHLFGRAALASGSLYGVKTAPGVLMGVGSVGAHLGRFSEARTYMSRDGGRTWSEARQAQTVHAFADHGAVLALVEDGLPTDALTYSADGGSTWRAHRFVDEQGARVVVERLLGGSGGEGGGQGVLLLARAVSADGIDGDSTVVVFIDFSRLFARQCAADTRDHARSDFELWTPRHGLDASGRSAPVCVLGVETSYWRRKPQAACYVGDEFAPPRTAERQCTCTLADYECDEGFWLDDYGHCALDGPDPDAPPGCRAGTKYRGRSGYRHVPHTQCIVDPAADWTKPVDRVCGLSGGVRASTHVLDAAVADVQYFGKSQHVLVRSSTGAVLASFDEGATWETLTADGEALAPVASIVRQPYFSAHAYLLPTHGTQAFYTDDEARTLRRLPLPLPPVHASLGAALRFHPDTPDWLLFVGQRNTACGGHVDSADCRLEAFVSRDHGAHWDALAASLGAAGCAFLKTDRLTHVDARAIACLRHAPAGGSSVDVSTKWFASGAPVHVLAHSATDFALVGGFLLVSQEADDGRALRMLVSLDGASSAAARFPGNKATVDAAYTVLEPPEGFEYQDARGRTRQMPGGGVMLHVTKSSTPGAEWGTLYTSNSNGTYYTQALPFVNRDESGLVDFERLRALEGVALANVVANAQDVAQRGAKKQLQTLVTDDGGARWHYLRVTGDRLPCRVTAPKTGTCALHLHGYTEVSDPENIYSAAGAVGLAVGVGTVGASLGRLGESDTYLSADGGASWRMVRRGAMWHAFGDHGALIVVADRLKPVASVEYSLDQGRSWLTLPLPENARGMRVDRLASTPDATSRRFLLHGHRDAAPDQGILTSLDFTAAQPRTCVSSPDGKPDAGDFELFTPAPISGDGCLLGRRVHYYRRKPDAMCAVGDEFRATRYLADTCECTARDYECNHNFVRDPSSDARCVLIEGMQAPRTNCTTGQKDYFVIESAYRRIPQSICKGGLVLDRPKEVWCPGKASFMALLWSLFLAAFFLSLAYVAYHVWRARFPYLRLEDVGSVAAPALRHLQGAEESRVARRLAPVFFGALATARAVGRAARESVLWSVDRAAPYLPHAVQRWSYEHPPRWGSLTMDGRDRRAVRSDATRYRYHHVDAGEAAARVFGDGVDEYDEVEAGFNHFLQEEEFAAGGFAEHDAQVVDRQVLFANTELSDEDDDVVRHADAVLSGEESA